MMTLSRNPWVTIGFCCLMQAFTAGIGMYGFALFVVPWIQEFAVERSVMMVAITGASLVATVISPLCGWLLDKYDSKLLIIISLLSFVAALLLIAVAPSQQIIIAIFMGIIPIGLVLAGPLMAYSLAARKITEKRGLAMGVTALGSSLGGFVMPFVITLLLANYSWRTTFFLLAIMVVLAVILPALFVLSRDRPQQAQPQNGQTLNDQSDDPIKSRLTNLPAILMLGVSYMIPAMLFVAVLHNLGAFAVDIGISQAQAGLIISCSSVLMALGKVTSGAFSDRLNHLLLYLLLVGTMAASMVITALADTFTVLLLGVCLLALVVGGVAPLIANIIAKRWPLQVFGRVMGIVQAFAGISGAGPLIAALIRDSAGGYTQAFIWLSVLLLPAACCFVLASVIKNKPLVETLH